MKKKKGGVPLWPLLLLVTYLAETVFAAQSELPMTTPICRDGGPVSDDCDWPVFESPFTATVSSTASVYTSGFSATDSSTPLFTSTPTASSATFFTQPYPSSTPSPSPSSSAAPSPVIREAVSLPRNDDDQVPKDSDNGNRVGSSKNPTADAPIDTGDNDFNTSSNQNTSNAHFVRTGSNSEPFAEQGFAGRGLGISGDSAYRRSLLTSIEVRAVVDVVIGPFYGYALDFGLTEVPVGWTPEEEACEAEEEGKTATEKQAELSLATQGRRDAGFIYKAETAKAKAGREADEEKTRRMQQRLIDNDELERKRQMDYAVLVEQQKTQHEALMQSLQRDAEEHGIKRHRDADEREAKHQREHELAIAEAKNSAARSDRATAAALKTKEHYEHLACSLLVALSLLASYAALRACLFVGYGLFKWIKFLSPPGKRASNGSLQPSDGGPPPSDAPPPPKDDDLPSEDDQAPPDDDPRPPDDPAPLSDDEQPRAVSSSGNEKLSDMPVQSIDCVESIEPESKPPNKRERRRTKRKALQAAEALQLPSVATFELETEHTSVGSSLVGTLGSPSPSAPPMVFIGVQTEKVVAPESVTKATIVQREMKSAVLPAPAMVSEEVQTVQADVPSPVSEAGPRAAMQAVSKITKKMPAAKVTNLERPKLSTSPAKPSATHGVATNADVIKIGSTVSSVVEPVNPPTHAAAPKHDIAFPDGQTTSSTVIAARVSVTGDRNDIPSRATTEDAAKHSTVGSKKRNVSTVLETHPASSLAAIRFRSSTPLHRSLIAARKPTPTLKVTAIIPAVQAPVKERQKPSGTPIDPSANLVAATKLQDQAAVETDAVKVDVSASSVVDHTETRSNAAPLKPALDHADAQTLSPTTIAVSVLITRDAIKGSAPPVTNEEVVQPPLGNNAEPRDSKVARVADTDSPVGAFPQTRAPLSVIKVLVDTTASRAYREDSRSIEAATPTGSQEPTVRAPSTPTSPSFGDRDVAPKKAQLSPTPIDGMIGKPSATPTRSSNPTLKKLASSREPERKWKSIPGPDTTEAPRQIGFDWSDALPDDVQPTSSPQARTRGTDSSTFGASTRVTAVRPSFVLSGGMARRPVQNSHPAFGITSSRRRTFGSSLTAEGSGEFGWSSSGISVPNDVFQQASAAMLQAGSSTRPTYPPFSQDASGLDSFRLPNPRLTTKDKEFVGDARPVILTEEKKVVVPAGANRTAPAPIHASVNSNSVASPADFPPLNVNKMPEARSRFAYASVASTNRRISYSHGPPLPQKKTPKYCFVNGGKKPTGSVRGSGANEEMAKANGNVTVAGARGGGAGWQRVGNGNVGSRGRGKA
ncbi:hypothetical protein QFC21_003229 [Naganishia friedmannii]|uniref:Uncharacterized protein n=1 Tax=Naganishia friedmannii TaxID=89922 RepID=A0ACC2VR42_9TREE|nr:hypothetical protein QFC21_003229 [Naganishia friedmannii]